MNEIPKRNCTWDMGHWTVDMGDRNQTSDIDIKKKSDNKSNKKSYKILNEKIGQKSGQKKSDEKCTKNRTKYLTRNQRS